MVVGITRRKLVIGVVVGIACVLLGIAVMQQTKTEQVPLVLGTGNDTVSQVCVTTKEVAAGEVLTQDNVARVNWLEGLMPEGVLREESSCWGQIAAHALPKNAVLSTLDLDGSTTALEIPESKSVICIPTSETRSIGGAVYPGSKIDIFAISEGRARLLTTGVDVLRTSRDQASGPMPAAKSTQSSALSWVIIAVPPEQCEQLIALAAQDALYLSRSGDAVRIDVPQVPS